MDMHFSSATKLTSNGYHEIKTLPKDAPQCCLSANTVTASVSFSNNSLLLSVSHLNEQKIARMWLSLQYMRK